MNAPKKSAWDGYRRWRMIARVTFPVTVYMISSGKITLLTWPLFMLSAAALIGTELFDCPRCGGTFFYISGFTTKYSKVRFGGHRPFAQKCVHCGFPKWEEPQEKPEAYTTSRERTSRPDPVNAERIRMTNFLTLVLRDDPGAINLRLDTEGWAGVDRLVDRANRYGIRLTRENLADVLAASEKPSFEWDQPGDRIRVVRS